MAESMARARLARVERALALKAEGLSTRMVACRIGLSCAHVADWFVRPEEALRKARLAVELEGRRVEARRLRAEGASVRSLAQRYGVAVSTIGAWLTDPDGEKSRARKERYGGTCGVCGGPTSYQAGGPAATCVKCRHGRTELDLMAANRPHLCGVLGCEEPWAEGRFVCAEHAPTYDRIRVELEREEARGGDRFNSQYFESRSEPQPILAAA